jgi:RNA polymerase sigma-70 factor, ECF subfamily
LAPRHLPKGDNARCILLQAVGDVSALEDGDFEKLAQRAQAGDKAAYDVLIRRAIPVLRAFFSRSSATANDCDDLVQETLIAVHRVLHTYDRNQPFLPWLISIARRRLYDSYRRSASRARVLDSVGATTESSSDPMLRLNAAIDCDRLTSTLEPEKRALVRTIHLEGFSVKEIAEAQGETPLALKVRLHRALATLKRYFGGGE